MINITLFEPEIPPNTGNIIRLCANTGFKLNLIKPLGFSLEHKQLRRAGLDYAEFAELAEYDNFAHYLKVMTEGQIYACTTRASRPYNEVEFKPNDTLLFGPETRGLPGEILDSLDNSQLIRVPMQPHSRSLNLSNAVAIIAFEAWRQLGFEGAE